MIRVLFVCTGNICRSPAAEGVFLALAKRRGLADRVTAESAGTGSWHIGEAPDARMRAAAARRGIDIGDQRARQIKADDFRTYDYIVAMDRGHLGRLTRLCPPEEAHRLRLFLDPVPDAGTADVPDPYFGGGKGFERVMDLAERGAAALLDEIEEKHF